MGTLCIIGGVIGYVRTRSIPSIVAGIGYVLSYSLYLGLFDHRPFCHRHPRLTCSIGAMYLFSGNRIHKDEAYGLQTALGE